MNCLNRKINCIRIFSISLTFAFLLVILLPIALTSSDTIKVEAAVTNLSKEDLVDILCLATGKDENYINNNYSDWIDAVLAGHDKKPRDLLVPRFFIKSLRKTGSLQTV